MKTTGSLYAPPGKRNVVQGQGRELFQHNIRLRHSACLFAIKELGDKATPYEIAKIVHRRPHSVPVMLTRMEKNGLIKKHKASSRGNRVIATLTPKGEQAFELSRTRESLHRIFSALPKTQRKQLQDCLKALWESGKKEDYLRLIFPFE